MNTSHELRLLEAEIHELESAVESQVRTQRKSAQLSLGIGLAIVLILGAFLVTNWLHFRREFTREKVTECLSTEIAAMSPLALQEIERLGRDLLPVYAAAFHREVDAAWPELAERLVAESTELGSGLLETTHGALRQTEARVLAGVEQQLLEAYPFLGDAVDRETLTREIAAVCEEELGGVLTEFDSLYSPSLERLQTSLCAHEIDVPGESAIEIKKRFLHLWLQLLDLEVMEL